MQTDRRTFCTTLCTALLAAKAAPAQPKPPQTTHPNVALIDRDRILAAANRALTHSPTPLTTLPAPPKPATPHDFYTLALDPNAIALGDDAPTNAPREAVLASTARIAALQQLTDDVPALAAAATLLRSTDPAKADVFTHHALTHLNAWFVAESTRMTPTLLYARVSPAAPATPNPEGIFDTVALAELAVSIPFLQLNPQDLDPIRQWFTLYLDWLLDSRLAGLARDRKDHHATGWLLQAVAFARLTGNSLALDQLRHRYKSVTLRAQIDETGIFPHELTSPTAFRDSLMNLDLLAGICELLTTRFDTVWTYELQDGPGMRSAIARFFPYIQHRDNWPYPADLIDFTELPGRRPSLLFAARAYSNPDYAALWQSLSTSPDPTSPAVIRSFPIRQPLLWITPPPPPILS